MVDSLKWFTRVLWNSFKLLQRNNPLILASSTAFFSTFALSPILVLLVSLFSFYFSDELVRNSFFQKVEGAFGQQSAEEIESIVNNLASFEGHWLITIGGSLFLLFVATTLFQVIRQAINLLWKIKRKRGHRFKVTLVERSKAAFFLLCVGILILLSVTLDLVVTFLDKRFNDFIPAIHDEVLFIVNIVFSLLIVTASFTILFKLLPDGKASWKVAFAGGLFTAVLFNVGKWILGQLLVYSAAVNVFGASASFALILLFIFYSSFILYFGASFTYVFADSTDQPISAGKYGDRFEISVSSSGRKTEEGPFPG